MTPETTAVKVYTTSCGSPTTGTVGSGRDSGDSRKPRKFGGAWDRAAQEAFQVRAFSWQLPLTALILGRR